MSSVSPAYRKRRLIWAVCRNHRIKRLVPCRCLDGHHKNLTKCLWRLEPDSRSSYFFFSPPAHLCAVTCMTDISLILWRLTTNLPHLTSSQDLVRFIICCLTSHSTIFQLYMCRIYVTTHRCEGGLKKFNLRSGFHAIDIS